MSPCLSSPVAVSSREDMVQYIDKCTHIHVYTQTNTYLYVYMDRSFCFYGINYHSFVCFPNYEGCCVVLVTQLCLTLCNPMDCSLPGSSVHGIIQLRILEWVTIPFSRGSSHHRVRTWVSHIASRFFII